MAQPSSSHHRERTSHHHHRTISSTTLLLVLSLILAVLAVMLSLPSSSQNSGNTEAGGSSGVWGYLSPKRSQALVAREHNVAVREAEVARREAELLAGAPGGVVMPQCSPAPSASPSTSGIATEVFIAPPPIHTVIKEVVREVDAAGPPGWWKDAGIRVEELMDREARVSDREKEVGKREEAIGRRETDVSRRETWIMEQLIALGNEQTIEEEVVYDTPRRKVKELPPLIETITQVIPPITHIETLTETVTVPPAANTRVAARPAPEEHVLKGPVVGDVKPTTAIEIVKETISVPPPPILAEEVEEVLEDPEDFRGRERRVTVIQRPRQTRPPTRW
ncbi:hypothetical protein Clacol_006592 [Clathrus columnatus]|uniref:Uncharacterized protein n=1 Tax=Clathrus columnatus TaxID=1419009 RepID=A0AAV5AIP3_9AGAM|nr:hypothetical protein Clacol_006592 [Clathrus columnatus]